MVRATLLAVALLAASATAADEKVKDPPAELDGEWKVVSWEANGMRADADAIADLVVTFKGKELSAKGKRLHARAWEVRLDPAKSPKEIDVVLKGEDGKPLLEDKDGKPVAALGIYKREGGKLTVCIREPDPDARRPVEFKAPRERGAFANLFVLERIGKK
jgi:uncharacterized protein (TIGR03067 family)